MLREIRDFEQYADEILKILTVCDLSYPLHEDNFEFKVTLRLREMRPDFKFTSSFGATKLVIEPKDADYVIKIPFNGWIDHYSDTNDDGEECEIREFFEFTNACFHDTEFEWDYCKREMFVMDQAITKNTEQYFANIIWIGDIDDHPIYIQEKAKIFLYDQKQHQATKEAKEALKEKSREHHFEFFCGDWLVDFYNAYGEEEYIRFMNFLRDTQVDDLYSANLGYICGRPVVVDYAGYND